MPQINLTTSDCQALGLALKALRIAAEQGKPAELAHAEAHNTVGACEDFANGECYRPLLMWVQFDNPARLLRLQHAFETVAYT